MGMIPIAVAFGGFLLLWMLLNYHTLRQRRQAFEEKQIAVQQFLQQRQVTVRALRTQSTEWPAALTDELPSHPLASDPFGPALTDWLAAHPAEHIPPATKPQWEVLRANEAQLTQARQEARQHRRFYNEFVRSAAGRFSAKLFGFRPV